MAAAAYPPRVSYATALGHPLIAVVLASASAVVWGTADFLGGLASRRSPALAVVIWSQLFGLAAVLAVVWFVPGEPGGAALLWGAAAGIVGGAGLVLFYRALAGGVMSVIAPTTAASAAALPVVAGLLMGERPSGTAVAGIILGLIGIVLVGQEIEATVEPGRSRRAGMVTALVAGAAFGGFFILMDQAPDESGLWPLMGARLASLAGLGAFALATRAEPAYPRVTRRLVAVAGLLDVTANALFLLAVQRGLLALVAVLASLYPAATVLLARAVLGERLARHQILGVGAVLGAVALIAAA